MTDEQITDEDYVTQEESADPESEVGDEIENWIEELKRDDGPGGA